MFKSKGQDIPGDPMVTNPPANAGDTSSVPSLGRFPVLQQLSLCTVTVEARAS